MKIFVTGPHSRLGFRVLESAQRRNFTVAGVESVQSGKRIVDITDARAVSEFFKREKPALVVHTSAHTDVDGAERNPETARKINVEGTRNIAEATESSGARLIHISTDYVFDGKSGPYSEEDQPHPVNVYGQTKLHSEEIVKRTCKTALIARICVPYDWNTRVKPNFLMWAVEKLRKGEELRAFTDQWSTPTCLPFISEAILDLAGKGCSGILHLADRECLNRYEFARQAAEVFGLNPELVKPTLTVDLNQAARRPMKGGLKVQKAENVLGRKLLTVREGLTKIKTLLN